MERNPDWFDLTHTENGSVMAEEDGIECQGVWWV